MNEEVTLKNVGTDTVDLSVYKLRDLAGKLWVFSGTLAAGQSAAIKRDGQPMAMNK